MGVAVVERVGDGWLLDGGALLGVGLEVGEDDRDGACVADDVGGSVGGRVGTLVGVIDGLCDREGGEIEGVLLGLNPEAMLEMGPPPPAQDAARSIMSMSAATRRIAFTPTRVRLPPIGSLVSESVSGVFSELVGLREWATAVRVPTG